MKFTRFLPSAVFVLMTCLATSARPEGQEKQVKEKPLDALHGLTIKIRMEGPYDADTPLQAASSYRYRFRYTAHQRHRL